MSEQTAHCDFQRLALLLAEQLSPAAEAETAEHLAVCETCRHQLEALAGDPEWWSTVEVCLREGETGEPHWSASAATCEPTPALDASFVAEFAIDFLEPCESERTLGKLGNIEILEVIGMGGMGVVLKGYQRELGRFVAVKMMAPHLAVHGSARKRFAREARAAAAVVHPHVMAIHSVNSTSRLPYLVMPYVACESLQQRLDREGPLGVQEILRIGAQAARGLAAAHAQGIVHRDVKPANMLLEADVDRVMLTDFGLARAVDDVSVTRSGVVAGTPQFMSPEQARGDSLDQRTDLFSLGSVMYAMCTGRPPFRAETTFGVLRRITDVEPRSIREINADVPAWLAAVVSRLHAKAPGERFESAAEVAALLEACLAHVQQPEVSPLPAALKDVSPARPGRGRLAPWQKAALTCAAAGAMAWGAWAIWPATGRSNDVDRQTPKPAAANDSRSVPSPGSAEANAAWNDGTDEQIDTLRDAAQELEHRADKLWDSPYPTPESEVSP